LWVLLVCWFCSLSVQSGLDFFVFSGGGISDEAIGGVCCNFVILWELLKWAMI